MSEPIVIALDSGTSMVKALAFDSLSQGRISMRYGGVRLASADDSAVR